MFEFKNINNDSSIRKMKLKRNSWKFIFQLLRRDKKRRKYQEISKKIKIEIYNLSIIIKQM